jgi:hypothetical protein
MTTTPTLPEIFVTSSTELLFPQFAVGGGFQTEFILLSDGGSAGTMYFFDQSGNPLSLPMQ